jgi:hypothetical protein
LLLHQGIIAKALVRRCLPLMSRRLRLKVATLSYWSATSMSMPSASTCVTATSILARCQHSCCLTLTS